MRRKTGFFIAVAGTAFLLTFGALGARGKGKAAAAGKIYVGTVSDTMCGAKHMMKGMSDAECVKQCVQHGSDYALVVGPKVYTLRGKQEETGKLTGQKVKITGTAAADVITVTSIEAAEPHK